MTEVSIRENSAVELAGGDDLSALARWALDARQAYLVAESLSKTTFVPDSMRGKPGEITAAILTGSELGLKPMSALRSIDIISGTPAMRAHALRGLAQAAGHQVWVEESTSTRAIVCGRRAGEEHVQRSVWTMDRAKQLGLDGKHNWRAQPQAMLIARATSEVCRLIASDVLLGMPYSIEEVYDDAQADGTVAEPPKRRTAKRRQVEAAPDLEPEITEPEPAPAEPAPVAEVERPEPVLYHDEKAGES